jgi:hypothetical protein
MQLGPRGSDTKEVKRSVVWRIPAPRKIGGLAVSSLCGRGTPLRDDGEALKPLDRGFEAEAVMVCWYLSAALQFWGSFCLGTGPSITQPIA